MVRSLHRLDFFSISIFLLFFLVQTFLLDAANLVDYRGLPLVHMIVTDIKVFGEVRLVVELFVAHAEQVEIEGGQSRVLRHVILELLCAQFAYMGLV